MTKVKIELTPEDAVHLRNFLTACMEMFADRTEGDTARMIKAIDDGLADLLSTLPRG